MLVTYGCVSFEMVFCMVSDYGLGRHGVVVSAGPVMLVWLELWNEGRAERWVQLGDTSDPREWTMCETYFKKEIRVRLVREKHSKMLCWSYLLCTQLRQYTSLSQLS